MAYRLSVDIDRIALVSDMAVSVDFHLHAAIGKDAFGHDGDHIDAFDLLADNKGGWFVIWVGRSGPNRGHKRTVAFDDVAVPIFRRSVF